MRPHILPIFQCIIFLSKEKPESLWPSHPTKYSSQMTSPVLAISLINAIICDDRNARRCFKPY